MSDQPQAGELVFTRVFEAPRELVFRCMTEPEHLTHFWGPAGVSTPLENIKVDLRPGGAFETVMVSDADGSQYAMRAVYVEVAAPERLVWTDPGTGMTTTSTFTDLGGARTEVRIRQVNVPEPFRSLEAQAGFVTSLDRYAAYLGALVTGQAPR
ncbi:MAG TPA: SRPBCC domain-containing protein [Streptosporangiaceae bacterium]|nr:SRPBCC domain-containing protein [Streptosporangiaceae bacterium]